MIPETTNPYYNVSILAIQDFIYSLKKDRPAHVELVNQYIQQLAFDWYDDGGSSCKN